MRQPLSFHALPFSAMDPAHYFAPAFLESLLRAQPGADAELRVLHVRPFAVDNSASILAVLTAGHAARPVGHFGVEITWSSAGHTHSRRLVLKLKPPGAEVAAMLASLAQATGEPLASRYPAYTFRTGFADTHGRELAVYEQHAGHPLLPEIWGLYADEEHGVYVVLMEFLEEVELLDSVMHPERWTDAHLRAALTQLATWHAGHLHTPARLPALANGECAGPAYLLEQKPLWHALLDSAATHFPELYSASRVGHLRQALADLPQHAATLAAEPHTLIHNDLNPRNTCFRRTPAGELQFVAYDWELATYHVPHYDVAELLCFVLDTDRYALRGTYLEYYRQQLHQLTGAYPDAEAFRHTFGVAALNFGLHRLGMYLMAHAVSPYPFLPRVVNSFFDTLEEFLPQPVAAPQEVAAA
ncbi:Phosphotransferase enzyme family protein [Hymenobacter gelipurpurascens]|uniref:Phosphotransferase enzyme family protein n=1 Tax=Hymenobacter gelipurpurascens TaxID=89968 RepID=A0A212T069_9BACT|nr:phosphotransferase [Hymenobacter gelipurpurascens]SNC59428.1 Phosphotransferase enzyme family protein [Hymenobacter gelipurpurascens]